MKIKLQRGLVLKDATDSRRPEDYNLMEGVHDVEVIPSPLGKGEDWIVLLGTKIGAPESLIRGCVNLEGADQIVIKN